MQQPPLLPEETLERVERLARFDGLSLLLLGALFAVPAAAVRDVPFAIIGLLAAGAGAIELHGLGLLREGDARGLNWLIGSQPLLLGVIWCYCVLRLLFFEPPPMPEDMADLAKAGAAQWGMPVEEYFRRVNQFIVGAVAVIALFYQGGMTLYYLLRREAVTTALGEPEARGGGEAEGPEGG
ncbi:MAG: hypothetical protein ACKODK_13440, partial [Opitutaceae bacterium]